MNRLIIGGTTFAGPADLPRAHEAVLLRARQRRRK